MKESMGTLLSSMKKCTLHLPNHTPYLEKKKYAIIKKLDYNNMEN